MKRKLTVIFVLLLLATAIGYFIYDNMPKKSKGSIIKSRFDEVLVFNTSSLSKEIKDNNPDWNAHNDKGAVQKARFPEGMVYFIEFSGGITDYSFLEKLESDVFGLGFSLGNSFSALKLLSDRKQLKYLSIGPDLEAVDFDVLKSLRELPQLEYLHITTTYPIDLSFVRELTNLKVLSIEGINSLTQQNLDQLTGINVKVLGIRGIKIENLDFLKSMPDESVIVFKLCSFANPQALQNLPQKMTRLGFWSCDIKDFSGLKGKRLGQFVNEEKISSGEKRVPEGIVIDESLRDPTCYSSVD